MIDAIRAARPFARQCLQLRRRLAAFASAAMLLVAFPVNAEDNAAAVSAVEFNIPAQPVAAALNEFAKQARVQLLFISNGFEDVEANPVVGTYDAQFALDLLLDGTGLAAQISGDSEVRIRQVPASDSSSFVSPRAVPVERSVAAHRPRQAPEESHRATAAESDEDSRAPGRLEEIVVTGTSIRGVIPESTPLEIFDATDIRNTGALTAEEFIATLPQNNNTLTEIGTGASSREPNVGVTSSVDLRGLGVGTTLVLLNGRRVAPSSNGRAADLSFIPLAAVDRIEVLTDGASAIYGSDAIGGVVNFVLKERQDGAQTVVSLGGTEGGSETLQIDQSFGYAWNGGNALVAASYMDRNDLDAADRTFANAAAPLSLIPQDTRRNLLLSASHEFPNKATISGDMLYSKRKPRTVVRQGLADRILSTSVDHEQLVANVELIKLIGDAHRASLLLTYSDAGSDRQTTRTPLGSGVSGTNLLFEDTATMDLTAMLDGTLLELRQNKSVSYAVGAGRTSDDLDQLIDATSVGQGTSSLASERDTTYAFAELHVPLISSQQEIRGVDRLATSLAARYTDYSDFGSKVSPKLGILWAPLSSLRIRSTIGESFKAPFLFQTKPAASTFLLFQPATLGFPDIWSTDGSSIMLMGRGTGNPNLGPEESRTFTVGFDLDIAALALSATYFDIDYTNRLAEPDPSGFLSLLTPQDFPEFFNLDPTLEQVTEVITIASPSNLTDLDENDPAAVHGATTVFFDNRVQNLSITKLEALDVNLRYTVRTELGSVDLGIRASRIFGFEERAREEAAAIPRLNTVLFPVDFKARAHIGLQRDDWNAHLNLNFVDEYSNPFDTGNPAVDAWTTLDLILSRDFTAGSASWLESVRVGLNIRNLLDEKPPLVTLGPTTNAALNEPIGFDPANANPLGRFVSLRFSVDW